VDWNVSRDGCIASNSCSFYVESKVAGLDHSDRTRTRLSYKQKESIRRVKAKILRPFRCPNKHTGRTCWCDVSVSQAPGSLGHSIVQFLLQPLSSQNYCHFLVSNLPCPKPLVLQPCSPFNSAIASTNLPCSASNLTRCLSRSGSSASNCAQTAASSTFKLFNRAFCT
jgi:hypothetical protein